jgi:hypothetical protein
VGCTVPPRGATSGSVGVVDRAMISATVLRCDLAGRRSFDQSASVACLKWFDGCWGTWGEWVSRDQASGRGWRRRCECQGVNWPVSTSRPRMAPGSRPARGVAQGDDEDLRWAEVCWRRAWVRSGVCTVGLGVTRPRPRRWCRRRSPLRSGLMLRGESRWGLGGWGVGVAVEDG